MKTETEKPTVERKVISKPEDWRNVEIGDVIEISGRVERISGLNPHIAITKRRNGKYIESNYYYHFRTEPERYEGEDLEIFGDVGCFNTKKDDAFLREVGL